MLTRPYLIAALLAGSAGVASVNAFAKQDGHRESDTRLESKLVTAYLLDEYLSPLELDIEVQDGVARLSGTVQTVTERNLAVELAWRIDGIRDVESRIQVDPNAWDFDIAGMTRELDDVFRALSDTALTARIKGELLLNDRTPGLAIDVETADQVVTLNGTARSQAQKDLAEEIAAGTDGVAGVNNHLEITPSAGGSAG